MGTVSFYLD